VKLGYRFGCHRRRKHWDHYFHSYLLMQTSSWAAPASATALRFREPSEQPARCIDPTWHQRAVHDATTVKRAFRGAAAGVAVIGLADTLDALDRGEIRELLLTARCRELHSDLVGRADELGRAGLLVVREIVGAGAIQLEMTGDGIGAILRSAAVLSRKSVHFATEAQPC
jgi:hypothetical protein